MSQFADVSKNRGHAIVPMEQGDDLPSRPSKLRKKNASRKKQNLGEKLVALSPGKLIKITLSDELREAIALYLRLTDHSARKRQLQYIGRIIDPADVEGIEQSLASIDRAPSMKKGPSPAMNAATAQAEAFLKAGDAALSDIAGQLPPDTLQMLRQTIRNARKKWHAGGTEEVALQAVRNFIVSHEIHRFASDTATPLIAEP